MHADIALKFLDAPALSNESGLDANDSSRNTVEQIAYKYSPATGPDKNSTALIWCGGLKSDMEGGKATHLHDWAISEGRAYVRFDYYGHGMSSGVFTKAGIGRWTQDTVQIIDEVVGNILGCERVILIGSSMGGWASLLAALQRPERVKGLLLIAPAPDFTETLMWEMFSADIKKQIIESGLYLEPSEYGEPMPISKTLIEDGKKHCLLDRPIEFSGPVRILQGMQDIDVPYRHAMKIIDAITSQDVEMTLVKSGDHRLSTEADLERLVRTIKALAESLES